MVFRWCICGSQACFCLPFVVLALDWGDIAGSKCSKLWCRANCFWRWCSSSFWWLVSLVGDECESVMGVKVEGP